MKGVTRLLGGLTLVASIGCANLRPAEPLTYVALERPEGAIRVELGELVELEWSRGRLYLLNWGFRPAADVRQYLGEAQEKAGLGVLRNVDVELGVPFAIDVLLFGVNFGTDRLRAGSDSD